MKSNNAVVGIYRHDAEGRGKEGPTTLVERVELDMPVKALLRGKGWKDRVRSEGAKRGFRVLAVSVIHGDANLDIDIALTVAKIPAKFGEKRKAATKSGRPVEGPIKTGKTMAAKRRAVRDGQ